MIRISNRSHDQKQIAGPQVQYIDRIVEVPVSQPVQTVIQTIENRIEVPVDHIVEIEKIIEVPVAIDLSIIHTHISNHEEYIAALATQSNKWISFTTDELEMQRRALIAIKTQRDIDRSRRLMLIKRMKKEQKAYKKQTLILKLALSASLILSLIALIK